jgi:hypothetical protein
VAASDSALLDGIRAFRWKEVFWTRRAQLHARLRMHVFGHGLYDQLRRPFVGLIGHGILLGVDQTVIDASPSEQLSALDAMLATAIGDPSCLRSPRDLQPVPLLGMPGWHEETASERFYDNVAYFRPGRNNHGVRSVS